MLYTLDWLLFQVWESIIAFVSVIPVYHTFASASVLFRGLDPNCNISVSFFLVLLKTFFHLYCFCLPLGGRTLWFVLLLMFVQYVEFYLLLVFRSCHWQGISDVLHCFPFCFWDTASVPFCLCVSSPFCLPSTILRDCRFFCLDPQSILLNLYVYTVVVVVCIYEPYVISHSMAMSSAECNPCSSPSMVGSCWQYVTSFGICHKGTCRLLGCHKAWLHWQNAQWPWLVQKQEVPNSV